MSKAIAIVPMPIQCGTCLFYGENEDTYEHYCRLSNRDDDIVSFYSKPDWCPLFIPEKRNIKNEGYFNSDIEQMVRQAEIDSYNEAIDDILGGT